MRIKRAQTRAADNAAAKSDPHDAGPVAISASAVPASANSKPLKRPHSVQCERLAMSTSASPAKTPESLPKRVAFKTDSIGEADKSSVASVLKSSSEVTGESDGKKKTTHIVEPTADSTKPLANDKSVSPNTNESQPTNESPALAVDKKRDQSPTKQKPGAKKPTAKANTPKKEAPKRDKKAIANKELKNLDIQLSGYSSVLDIDSMEATSDTNIKASISEIVKTKSRSSASQSIYSKAAAPQIDKDKPKPTEALDSNDQKKSPKEAAKKATTASPKATQISKMSITKKSTKTNAKKAKMPAGFLESASEALMANPDSKSTGNTQQLGEIKPVIAANKTGGAKAKPRVRARKPKPKTVPDPSSISNVNSNPVNTIKFNEEPNSTQTTKLSKQSPTNKRAKATKPNAPVQRRKPNLPSHTAVSTELSSSTPPVVAWTLQISDTLPFANSPNFSDPDTVTSPMVPVDASEPNKASSGNSHIRQMVADILQNLEMSDDVSGNEQPDILDKTTKQEDSNTSESKIELTTVKNIDLVEVGHSNNANEIQTAIKMEEDDQMADDTSKMEEATEASTTGTMECSTDATAGTSLDVTPTKKPPPPAKTTAKRKKPITQKQAKAMKAKASSNTSKEPPQHDDTASKDIYDFHESGNSSEDTSASYIRALSKRADDTEESQTNKTIPPLGDNKSSGQSTSKTSGQATDDEAPDEVDSSDSSDNKALATKMATKPSSKSTDESSNDSDSESGSDTSVRTRVNKRRKSAVKSRRLRLFGFYSGPKRHRMASLNALAKVQCLYENESRTAQELGFVREPRVAPRVRLAGGPDNTNRSAAATAAAAKKVAVAEEKEANKLKKEIEASATLAELEKNADKTLTSAEGSKTEEGAQKKTTSAESSSSDESEEEVKIDIDAPRTLRTVPGLRGAGKLWEMGNMSSFQSDSEPDDDDTYEQVLLKNILILIIF